MIDKKNVGDLNLRPKEMEPLNYQVFLNTIQFLDFNDIVSLVNSNPEHKEYAKTKEVKLLMKNKLILEKEKAKQITTDIRKQNFNNTKELFRSLDEASLKHKFVITQLEKYKFLIQGDELNSWLKPTPKQKEEFSNFFISISPASKSITKKQHSYYENGDEWILYYEHNPFVVTNATKIYMIHEQTKIIRIVHIIRIVLPVHTGADQHYLYE